MNSDFYEQAEVSSDYFHSFARGMMSLPTCGSAASVPGAYMDDGLTVNADSRSKWCPYGIYFVWSAAKFVISFCVRGWRFGRSHCSGE